MSAALMAAQVWDLNRERMFGRPSKYVETTSDDET